MTQNYTYTKKTTLKILIVFIFSFLTIESWGQQIVSWRAEPNNPGGLWTFGSTCEPAGDGQWFYQTWGGFRQAPDCFGSINDLLFDNNEKLVMSLNVRDYGVRSVTFSSSNNSIRTINAESTYRLFMNPNNVNPWITNNSSTNHIFNTPITLGATMSIRPIAGDLTFGNINLNSHFIDVEGNSGRASIFNGEISGTGGLATKNEGVTSTFNAQNTFSGGISIENGTLRLNRTGGNTIPSSNIVTISGGTLRVSQDQTLGNLTLTNGGLTIDSGATLTLSNNITIPSGFTITNNGTLVIEGTLTDNRGTKTFGGTVRYAAASGTQTVVGATYNNLELNGNATKNLDDVASVNENLSLNAGTLNLSTFTINRTSNGGTLTLAANTTLNIGGTNTFPANYATHTIATSITVSYDGTDQTVATLNGNSEYGNLILSGNGNKVFGGNITTVHLTNGADASTVIASGQNVRVKSILNNSGSFTVQNNANLIQEGTTNNNVGAITVLRESTPLRRLDYTLWSSPVAGQNLLSFSPLTMTNRFYTYNPSTNVYNSIAPNSNAFETGVGYLIRMPDDHPTTPEIWEGDFLGVPNSGTVTVTVANNTFNAIGNPYPSTIDADDFIVDNNLTEALYFWRKINAAAGSAYATYTLAGGVGTDTSGSNTQVPNGIIQVGQGFIARSTSTSFVFNNEMRLGNNDNQFFRTANTEHNRVRLALNGGNGLYQEVLVNYMTGATNELDPAIDGKYINDSQTAFYTLLNEEAYVIQGRALPFDNNDIVPLGFKTTQAGIYQISLMNADGLFTSEQQPIFIKDLDLNITHDFAEGSYSFTSELGIFDSRLELLFNNETLSVNQPELGILDILVFNKEGVLNIQSTQNTLKKVTLHDVNGRILLQQQPYSNTTQISLQEFSRQMILVTIETQNGALTTKKIIH